MGSGWRVPTTTEWISLIDYLESEQRAYAQSDSRDIRFESLVTGSRGGFDLSFGGFGTTGKSDAFQGIGEVGHYWTNNSADGTYEYLSISARSQSVQWNTGKGDQLRSCRCIKD